MNEDAKKLIPVGILYVISMILIYVRAMHIYPIDAETNTLLTPNWFIFVLLFEPAIFAFGVVFTPWRRVFRWIAGKVRKADADVVEPVFPAPGGQTPAEQRVAPVIPSQPAPIVRKRFVLHNSLSPLAVKIILESGQASVSMLQRRLKLGYSRAAQILDDLEYAGIVGPFDPINSLPRQVLITKEDYPYCDFVLAEDAELAKKDQAPASGRTAAEELARADQLDGHDFEYWCADLLRDCGYRNVEVTRASGDQGVDVLAEKDGITYAIQCKCYSHDLGNGPVQEVFAGKSLYHRHVGVVMTNRDFTASAREAADATGVLLWGREKLLDMLKQTIR